MPSSKKQDKLLPRSSHPTRDLIARGVLIKQGAEAKVYKTTFGSIPILIKHRFPKSYRLPILDQDLTRSRLTLEARALLRCEKAGIVVPGVRFVDPKEGVLGGEWIEGTSVREWLGAEREDESPSDSELEGEEEEVPEASTSYTFDPSVSRDAVLEAVGREIAKMHQAEVIHGDLTTSNMMLRSLSTSPFFEIVMIDFGLTNNSSTPEDRAVDLYVLERAFSSTHPIAVGSEEKEHFEVVLEAYLTELDKGKKGLAVKVRERLEEVRMRGRKRSMVG